MIKFDLTNRLAIITGGAQGFGLAITERFIQSGAKVVIWDIDEEAAKKAIDKVNSENLSYQLVDVSNFENITKCLNEVESKHGKIMLFFGVIGFFMRRYGFSVVPVIIGLILGELVEGTLRQSLVIFDGNWLMFLTRPIALTFFILSLIALAFPLLRGKKLKIKNKI